MFCKKVAEKVLNSFFVFNFALKGLGKRFVAQLQSALNFIKRNPFFASVR